MSKISFTVFGNPKALKRHRMSFRDKKGRPLKFPHSYDPSAKDKDDFLIMAMRNKPEKPIEIPICLTVATYFGRPKSHFNKKGLKLNAPDWYSSSPDADNILKFIGDSLNGIFWKDDRLIVQAIITKFYSDSPRTEIKIEF